VAHPERRRFCAGAGERLWARRGAKKAIGAVAASILTAAYEMLKSGALYEDLGGQHFDTRGKVMSLPAATNSPSARFIDRQTAAQPALSRRLVSL
jgi:hypothetical protein